MIFRKFNKKTPVRKFDHRRVKIGYSYIAKDLAKIFNTDCSVVHRWVREEGLIPIDEKIPAMFHFETTKQFIIHKNQARKMQIGNAGDLPCFKCRLKRRAYKDKVILIKQNDKLWNLKALCCACGSKMNMSMSANEFTLMITWGYLVVETLPKFTLIGISKPNVTTNLKNIQTINKFEYKGCLNFCSNNERIKHKYFDRLAQKFDKKTIAKIVYALLIFEEFNNFKDFKLFCYEDSKNFQKYLLKRYTQSMQTANRAITYVKQFFLWLREHEGYKKLCFDDIDSLQLSLKDREKARVNKPKDYLSIDKWQEIILNLKPIEPIEYRNRAIFTCLILTGARVDALISLKIKDVNLEHNYIFQDSSHVNTKFSSSHKINLWNFNPELKQILEDWIDKLKNEYGFNDNCTLFPKIRITSNNEFKFEADGFIKEPIKSTSIVRKELTKQLNKSNLGHYTPHTIRNSLIALFMGFDLNPEQLKAISQNMCHKSLNTTINSYYNVHEYRQDKIIQELNIEDLTKLQEVKNNPKYQYIISQMKNEEIINKVFDVVSQSN